MPTTELVEAGLELCICCVPFFISDGVLLRCFAFAGAKTFDATDDCDFTVKVEFSLFCENFWTPFPRPVGAIGVDDSAGGLDFGNIFGYCKKYGNCNKI